MPLQDLVQQESTGVITDADRIMHTTKMVERTFGVAASNLGDVVVQDGRAVLSFDYAGAKHTLRWERQSSGGIFWYLDGSAKAIVLSSSDRALTRLQEALDG